MIEIKEIPVEQIDEFWTRHLKYLVDDGIIDDEEDPKAPKKTTKKKTK